MAIFGIGANYDGEDMFSDFIDSGCACIGWRAEDNPPADAILHHLRTGDLIYIKSFTPALGLTVKAVGVVMKGLVEDRQGMGRGVPVRWVWTGEEHVGKVRDKWPVRSVTIYEEFHPEVQERVIGLLLSGNKRHPRRPR